MDAILNRRPETGWDRFKASPLLFFARLVFYSNSRTRHSTHSKIRVVCISDTHNSHLSQPPLPDGDILIHSGDLTQSGSKQELDAALSWLNSQPHPHKLFIAGNHDSCLVSPETRLHITMTFPGLVYLENESTDVVVRGHNLHIYGSPYTPKHGSFVFQYPRVRVHEQGDSSSHDIWSSIPPLADIVITHGPPFAHLDLNGTGCYALLKALWRVRPRLHVFGHVHGGRGVEFVNWDKQQQAYEDICAGKAGWGGFARLTWWTLVGWFSPGETQGTVLVNAAAVGGLKDDQMKGAIVVDI
ncbi:hypothetical protein VNI00_019381 [Paramarasmius palmivorus]|uniref:Calcineurin-like phosphoesterase domain-containing protein n=1 Tax=Paramarasmius palmivorus TaxID=297713 RepID=A0AAW0AMF1_9AGAR